MRSSVANTTTNRTPNAKANPIATPTKKPLSSSSPSQSPSRYRQQQQQPLSPTSRRRTAAAAESSPSSASRPSSPTTTASRHRAVARPTTTAATFSRDDTSPPPEAVRVPPTPTRPRSSTSSSVPVAPDDDEMVVGDLLQRPAAVELDGDEFASPARVRRGIPLPVPGSPKVAPVVHFETTAVQPALCLSPSIPLEVPEAADPLQELDRAIAAADRRAAALEKERVYLENRWADMESKRVRRTELHDVLEEMRDLVWLFETREELEKRLRRLEAQQRQRRAMIEEVGRARERARQRQEVVLCRMVDGRVEGKTGVAEHVGAVLSLTRRLAALEKRELHDDDRVAEITHTVLGTIEALDRSREDILRGLEVTERALAADDRALTQQLVDGQNAFLVHSAPIRKALLQEREEIVSSWRRGRRELLQAHAHEVQRETEVRYHITRRGGGGDLPPLPLNCPRSGSTSSQAPQISQMTTRMLVSPGDERGNMESDVQLTEKCEVVAALRRQVRDLHAHERRRRDELDGEVSVREKELQLEASRRDELNVRYQDLRRRAADLQKKVIDGDSGGGGGGSPSRQPSPSPRRILYRTSPSRAPSPHQQQQQQPVRGHQRASSPSIGGVATAASSGHVRGAGQWVSPRRSMTPTGGALSVSGGGGGGATFALR
eukprot:PhM_4_TR330/c1_g1_i1/m.55049